ncbi:hypothetical protein WK92_17845 [Burkholderia ubonensis]|nr:hypothetical protein WK82_15875 [Burkholderia ubonensis]KVW19826.1 hypothetical protein WK92_17845 [Burkholderia ubonensis]
MARGLLLLRQPLEERIDLRIREHLDAVLPQQRAPRAAPSCENPPQRQQQASIAAAVRASRRPPMAPFPTPVAAATDADALTDP